MCVEEDGTMAIIINFQEYVKTKKKKCGDAKTDNILLRNGQIIHFNREDVSL